MLETDQQEATTDGKLTEAEKQTIARIDQVSQMGRTAWLGLLAYLAFAFVSLLGVRDADFFVLSRQTQLPLIDVSIPTAALFATAPVLGAALYLYLQILLLKLWDAIAAAPATMANKPLGELVHPWLVNDVALMLRNDGSIPQRPLSRLTGLVTRFLVWGAAPLVLFGYWWGSMPAHYEGLTLLAGFWFLLTLFAGFTTWWTAVHRLGARSADPVAPWKKPWRMALAGLTVLAVVLIGWARTEGFSSSVTAADRIHVPTRSGDVDVDGYVAGEWIGRAPAWSLLAPIDLGAVELVELPDDWRTPETARKAFRETWCRREAIPMEVCDHLPESGRPAPPHLQTARGDWCDERGVGDITACEELFAAYDERFRRDWAEERESTLSSLPTINLNESDLRRARAFGASLVGASLYRARLSGADLSQAKLEAADLRLAELIAVDLSGARLENAVLWGAYLAETDLSGSRLDGADLSATRLEFADFSDASMENTDLQSTWLYLADLHHARLQQADFGEAFVVASALLNADLRSVRWSGAQVASAFHDSDLRGAVDLTQAQLDASIGNAHTLLPDGTAPDTGAPFHVFECWKEPPVAIESIVDRFGTDAYVTDGIRQPLLCPLGHEPSPTGTPLALNAPYPDEHPLARAQIKSSD